MHSIHNILVFIPKTKATKFIRAILFYFEDECIRPNCKPEFVQVNTMAYVYDLLSVDASDLPWFLTHWMKKGVLSVENS